MSKTRKTKGRPVQTIDTGATRSNWHPTSYAQSPWSRVQGRPARKIDDVARVIFSDTVTARMLRRQMELGARTQAEFLDEYHVRCERAHPSTSSFNNNFGRFVRADWRLLKQTAIKKDRTGRATANRITWTGPMLVHILASIDAATLAWAFESMERQMSVTRATDPDDEVTPYVVALQNEMSRRREETSAPVSQTWPLARPRVAIDGKVHP